MAILEIGPNRECIPSFGSLGQRFTTSPEAQRRPPEAILRGKQDNLNFLAIILEILVRSPCQEYQMKDYITLMQFPPKKCDFSPRVGQIGEKSP